MSAPQNADRYLTKRWPYGTSGIVYYVRPGGNDNNDGLSPATAFATLERALHFMAIAEVNESVIVDVTGMTGADAISGESVLNLGGTTLGGMNFDRDVTVVPPGDLFFSRRHRQIRAELQLVQALDITGQAQDPTTGLLTLTVSDAIAPGALVGKFAVSGALGEYGTIASHTDGAGPNTIQVACVTTFSVPAGTGAYAPGATIRFGDPANAFEGAIYLNALCDWTLQGLLIESNGPKAAAIAIWPQSPVDFLFCDIEGIEMNEGGGVVSFECCYLHETNFIHDGATVYATQSVFRELTFLCHGSGAAGLTEIVACMFGLILTPFGGGNVESRYSFYVTQCQFDNAVNAAVQAWFGISRIQQTVIQNSGGSAVVATNHVTLYLDNVQGGANVGYGVEATLGAIVSASNGTAVTGTIDDLLVGDLGAAAWADAPLSDTDQLVAVRA